MLIDAFCFRVRNLLECAAWLGEATGLEICDGGRTPARSDSACGSCRCPRLDASFWKDAQNSTVGEVVVKIVPIAGPQWSRFMHATQHQPTLPSTALE